MPSRKCNIQSALIMWIFFAQGNLTIRVFRGIIALKFICMENQFILDVYVKEFSWKLFLNSLVQFLAVFFIRFYPSFRKDCLECIQLLYSTLSWFRDAPHGPESNPGSDDCGRVFFRERGFHLSGYFLTQRTTIPCLSAQK